MQTLKAVHNLNFFTFIPPCFILFSRRFCRLYFILALSKAVTKVYGICGTGFYANAAAYTFRMIRRFGHIHIHIAGGGAFSAGNAFIFINLNSKQRHSVKQRIECTKRAQPFAEGTVNPYAQYRYYQQNA